WRNNFIFSGNTFLRIYNLGHTSFFIIPSRIGGRDITAIAANAFERAFVDSVFIPDTIVTPIGNNMFSAYASLLFEAYGLIIRNNTIVGFFVPSDFDNTLNIPPQILGIPITAIEKNAFVNASNVDSIYVPPTITTIGKLAFANCFFLTKIVLPATVENIADNAFFNCFNLTSVFYEGTSWAAWNAINISPSGNSHLFNATIYFYSASEPTTPGNFWFWDHANGGVPTPWTVPFANVSFNLNGGAGTFINQEIILNNTVQRPQANPTRDRFAFRFWALSTDLSKEYDWSAPVTQDITLVAVWHQLVATVTFNLQGGQMSGETQMNFVIGNPYGTLPTPSREGFVFNGWWTTLFLGSNIGSSTIVTQPTDHNLWARWTPAPASPTWTGPVNTAFAGGDGTSENPFQIATAGQLALLASIVNTPNSALGNLTFNSWSENKFFILVADIDLDNIPWVPIGRAGSVFLGNFDGNGFVIRGLSPCAAALDRGLFGIVNGGIFKDIVFEDSSLVGLNFGGITGRLMGKASIVYTTFNSCVALNCLTKQEFICENVAI
ncbi:MAG: InlB B-repeat-containing protein, partial [Firmicutes bacterium]|nr:InlB B-repeat-containing protein [Bacillota bacterium]